MSVCEEVLKIYKIFRIRSYDVLSRIIGKSIGLHEIACHQVHMDIRNNDVVVIDIGKEISN